MEIADPYHAVLSREPRVGGHARVGGADVLAPPVVVHLIDAIDQHEAGLGEVVRRGHDDVPHAACRQRLVDLAADEAVVTRDVGLGRRPFAPHVLGRVAQVRLVGLEFLLRQREGELPVAIVLHRLDELVCHQQRQVELPQATVLALGADELHRIGVADVERAHLRAAAAAGGGNGEAHLVVDIHERQRARGVGAGAGHVGAARPKRREFVADAAAGLKREPRLVHLVQDVVHRVGDRARHRAVDRRGRGLVIERACVRGDAPGRDCAFPQRPKETLAPFLAHRLRLDIRERNSDALVGVVHGVVDRRAVFGRQSVFLVPDVEGRFLEGNCHVGGLDLESRAHLEISLR